jgi:predicted transcriptional regulator
MQRDKLNILRDIMSVIIYGKDVRKTHVLYKANLSGNLLEKYFLPLVQKGLIEQQGEFYVATRNGVTFFKELDIMLDKLWVLFHE